MKATPPRSSPPPPETWHPFVGLPELVLLGHGTTHTAVSLPRHSHPGLMTILYLVRGLVWLRVGHDELDFHGGQLVTIPPGAEKAGGDDVLAPCELYWLLLRLPRRCPRGFLGLQPAQGRTLHRALWRRPSTVQFAPATAPGLLADLAALARQRDALSALAGRATLLRLLALLCQPPRPEPAARVNSAAVSAAVGLMRTHLATPLSIPAIARRVGLSPSHFHRQFNAETGVTPGSFYLWQRVAAARRLLRESNLSIVEIALRCGFTSSQYFAICFRRQCGQTPRAYRASKRPTR